MPPTVFKIEKAHDPLFGVGVGPFPIGPYSIVKDLSAFRTFSIRFSMLSGAEVR